MDPIFESLFELTREDKLTPQQEANAVTAIDAIKRLQSIKELEIKAYNELKLSIPSFKVEPPKRITLDQTDSDGRTMLIEAAHRGHIAIASKLIDEKAALNIRSSAGHTALMHAADKGHTKIAAMLIKGNEELNIQDNVGNTALMLAAVNGYAEIAAMLIQSNVELNIQNSVGNTALMLAADKGYTEIASILIQVGKNLNIRSSAGHTALMHAADKGHTKIAAMLIKGNEELNIQDSAGRTALILAADKGYTEIAAMLIQSNAELNIQDSAGRTALIYAAAKNHTKIVAMLIQSNAELNIQNIVGSTALMQAISNGYPETASILIQAGANLNIFNNKGVTALRVAIQNSNLPLVYELLAHDAKIDDPYLLQAFLNSQQLNPQVHFCFGVLQEQKGNIPEAIRHYNHAFSCYTPAIRRLGAIAERKNDISGALVFYIQACKQGDHSSLSRLVNIARENASNSPGYKAITTTLYSHLTTTSMQACLSTEQWNFLASDALGNSYFSSMEGIQFALQAAKKAEEQAKTEEEKCIAAATKQHAERMFNQVNNPLHGTLSETKEERQEQAKEDHQGQLGAFLRTAVNESSIINRNEAKETKTLLQSIFVDETKAEEKKSTMPGSIRAEQSSEFKTANTPPVLTTLSSQSSSSNLKKSLFNTVFSTLASMASTSLTLGVAHLFGLSVFGVLNAWNPVGWVAMGLGIGFLLCSAVMLSINNNSISKGLFLSLTPGLNIFWSLKNVAKHFMTDTPRVLLAQSSAPLPLGNHPTPLSTLPSSTYVNLNGRIPISPIERNSNSSQPTQPLVTSEPASNPVAAANDNIPTPTVRPNS